MPVNQPAIKEDPTESSWDLEVTLVLNTLEQRYLSLLQAIEDATDLNDLKERARRL